MFTIFVTKMLSIKVADLHYKIKDTDTPLYFVYGGIFVSIWGAVMVTLFNGG
jgi:hypothetical protein